MEALLQSIQEFLNISPATLVVGGLSLSPLVVFIVDEIKKRFGTSGDQNVYVAFAISILAYGVVILAEANPFLLPVLEWLAGANVLWFVATGQHKLRLPSVKPLKD